MKKVNFTRIYSDEAGDSRFGEIPVPLAEKGEIEIGISTGEKRTFKGGDVLLVEDATGKGHRTRQLSPGTRRSLFITLA